MVVGGNACILLRLVRNFVHVVVTLVVVALARLVVSSVVNSACGLLYCLFGLSWSVGGSGH